MSGLCNGIWGGGHTPETDPTSAGWKCRDYEHVMLAGRKGVEGCFSARRLSAGILDVAIYVETPKEVHNFLNGGDYLDAIFVKIQEHPGWGLEAIRLVEKELRELEETRKEMEEDNNQ